MTMAAPMLHAVIPANQVLWRRAVLEVYFYQEEVPSVQYKGSSLKSWQIMDLVKEKWSMEDIEHGEHVPRFKRVNDPSKAQIRVQFGT